MHELVSAENAVPLILRSKQARSLISSFFRFPTDPERKHWAIKESFGSQMSIQAIIWINRKHIIEMVG